MTNEKSNAHTPRSPEAQHVCNSWAQQRLECTLPDGHEGPHVVQRPQLSDRFVLAPAEAPTHPRPAFDAEAKRLMPNMVRAEEAAWEAEQRSASASPTPFEVGLRAEIRGIVGRGENGAFPYTTVTLLLDMLDKLRSASAKTCGHGCSLTCNHCGCSALPRGGCAVCELHDSLNRADAAIARLRSSNASTACAMCAVADQNPYPPNTETHIAWEASSGVTRALFTRGVLRSGSAQPAAPAVDASSMKDEIERLTRQLFRAREALEDIAKCDNAKGYMPELAQRVLRSIADLDAPPTAEG